MAVGSSRLPGGGADLEGGPISTPATVWIRTAGRPAPRLRWPMVVGSSRPLSAHPRLTPSLIGIKYELLPTRAELHRKKIKKSRNKRREFFPNERSQHQIPLLCAKYNSQPKVGQGKKEKV
ncbi:hypothetical protein E2562_026529 [Oryza meyeriana var. granulata]|uniref:Uncharacterized protein n=1 Tax=Oryza meyeriana var. granulata TaxID=110450 RepID=A0A6G1DPK8_9ORYZ|nr:hypothetical protein E2562_026529 [Oryza meyeriana var. granulata]